MRNERLLKIIGDVDEELIWQADHLIPEAPKPAISWKIWARVAVSFVLVVAIGLTLRNAMGDRKKDSTMVADLESSEESAAEESYAEEGVMFGNTAEEEKETPAEEEPKAFGEEKAEAAQEEPREEEADEDRAVEEEAVAEEEAEEDAEEAEAYGGAESSDTELTLVQEADGSLTLHFAEGEPVRIHAWYAPGAPDFVPYDADWTILAAKETTIHLPKDTESGWIMVEATWPDDRVETYYKYYEER